MTVLVDTGVLYAQVHERAPRHRTAASALGPVVQGDLGTPFVSDYIVDEVFTLTRTRTGRFDLARRVVDRLLGRAGQPHVFSLLRVDPGDFEAALSCLDRYRDHDLSFTDATTVALAEGRDIDHVLSFDDGFDGVVDRLDPARVAEAVG